VAVRERRLQARGASRHISGGRRPA
jgi:hypothetical protein